MPCVSDVSVCWFNKMADAESERSNAVNTVPDDVPSEPEPERRGAESRTDPEVSILDRLRPPAPNDLSRKRKIASNATGNRRNSAKSVAISVITVTVIFMRIKPDIFEMLRTFSRYLEFFRDIYKKFGNFRKDIWAILRDICV